MTTCCSCWAPRQHLFLILRLFRPWGEEKELVGQSHSKPPSQLNLEKATKPSHSANYSMIWTRLSLEKTTSQHILWSRTMATHLWSSCKAGSSWFPSVYLIISRWCFFHGTVAFHPFGLPNSTSGIASWGQVDPINFIHWHCSKPILPVNLSWKPGFLHAIRSWLVSTNPSEKWWSSSVGMMNFLIYPICSMYGIFNQHLPEQNHQHHGAYVCRFAKYVDLQCC